MSDAEAESGGVVMFARHRRRFLRAQLIRLFLFEPKPERRPRARGGLAATAHMIQGGASGRMGSSVSL